MSEIEHLDALAKLEPEHLDALAESQPEADPSIDALFRQTAVFQTKFSWKKGLPPRYFSSPKSMAQGMYVDLDSGEWGFGYALRVLRNTGIPESTISAARAYIQEGDTQTLNDYILDWSKEHASKNKDIVGAHSLMQSAMIRYPTNEERAGFLALAYNASMTIEARLLNVIPERYYRLQNEVKIVSESMRQTIGDCLPYKLGQSVLETKSSSRKGIVKGTAKKILGFFGL